MSEPSDEMVNARIAEFDGWKKYGVHGWAKDQGHYSPGDWKALEYEEEPPDYTTSLDALVAPIEKLWDEHKYLCMYQFKQTLWYAEVRVKDTIYPDDKNWFEDKSPARALALAVYKVLEEIKNG